MITVEQATKAHVKKFGHDPLIIGFANSVDLAKEIAKAVVKGVPYDEYELLDTAVHH